jgi:hypothetical protein
MQVAVKDYSYFKILQDIKILDDKEIITKNLRDSDIQRIFSIYTTVFCAKNSQVPPPPTSSSTKTFSTSYHCKDLKVDRQNWDNVRVMHITPL